MPPTSDFFCVLGVSDRLCSRNPVLVDPDLTDSHSPLGLGIIILVLQKKKLRLNECKQLVQVDTERGRIGTQAI